MREIRAWAAVRGMTIGLAMLAFAGLPAGAWSAVPRSADTLMHQVQYYPYPTSGSYRTSSRPPPCDAYGSPFRGAARGAAGGAILGAIGGNAGAGAAAGAGFGLLRNAVRNSNARANGWCY